MYRTFAGVEALPSSHFMKDCEELTISSEIWKYPYISDATELQSA
jgi:hypothetical protein